MSADVMVAAAKALKSGEAVNAPVTNAAKANIPYRKDCLFVAG